LPGVWKIPLLNYGKHLGAVEAWVTRGIQSAANEPLNVGGEVEESKKLLLPTKQTG
jgi:hypothetical protein